MTKKKNKNLVAIICSIAVAVVVIIAVVIVVVFRGEKLDDSFFVSDDTKYALELDINNGMFDIADDVDMPVPDKSYIVYFYSGDKVTGVKMYYKYDNNATAKEATEYLNSEKAENDAAGEISSVETNGNYVVVTASNSSYEGMSADDAKQQVELMQMLQNMNTEE